MKITILLFTLFTLTACNRETRIKEKAILNNAITETLQGKRENGLTVQEFKILKELASFEVNNFNYFLEKASNEGNQIKLESDPVVGPYAKVLRNELFTHFFENPITKEFCKLPFNTLPKTRIEDLKTLWESYLKTPKDETINVRLQDGIFILSSTKTITALGREITKTTEPFKIDKDQIQILPHYKELGNP